MIFVYVCVYTEIILTLYAAHNTFIVHENNSGMRALALAHMYYNDLIYDHVIQ